MITRRRFILLIVIMAGTSTIVGGVTILKLYRAELEGQRNRLIELVQSQARLIEAVGHFDAAHSRADHAEGASGATLSQIKAAHRAYVGFGKTGEFTLARREGDRIVFLMSRRLDRDTKRKPIPFNSELAEPMRRALSGKSGWLIGLDWHGETVLAAHEPVPELKWGIVAKIDLAEIRAPFIWTAAAILGVGLLLALGGAFLFLYFTNPLMKQIEESRQRFERAVRGASDGLWEWNIRTNKFWRAPRWSELLGYADGELPPTFEAWESRLHPEDRARATEALRLHLEQKQPYDVAFRLRTKSGDYRWFGARGLAEWDRDGKAIRMAGSIRDITERERAEEAQRQSMNKLEQFNRLAVGREYQMIGLKRQVNELAAELGRSPIHDLSFLQTAEAPGGQDGA